VANPIKGEVDLPFEGVTLKFRLGLNELAELEKATGKNLQDVVNSGSLWMTREVLYIGTRRYHPEVTREDLGDLLGQITDGTIGERIMESVQLAAPAVLSSPLGQTKSPNFRRKKTA
jgi:hypothetical protein